MCIICHSPCTVYSSFRPSGNACYNTLIIQSLPQTHTRGIGKTLSFFFNDMLSCFFSVMISISVSSLCRLEMYLALDLNNDLVPPVFVVASRSFCSRASAIESKLIWLQQSSFLSFFLSTVQNYASVLYLPGGLPTTLNYSNTNKNHYSQ